MEAKSIWNGYFVLSFHDCSPFLCLWWAGAVKKRINHYVTNSVEVAA